jgi:photosystem II stability/assembly factor-like uncharacterized protein
MPNLSPAARLLVCASLLAACADESPTHSPGTQNTTPSVRPTTWTLDTSDRFGGGPGNNAFGVHGSAADNVFAVGDSGRISRFDGTTWTRMESPTTASLADVWVAGPGSAFAVGNRGTILRLAGTTWSVMPTPLAVTEPVRGIWGTSPTNVYAIAGAGRLLLHFDGTEWVVTKLRLDNIADIHGSAPNNIYVVGSPGVVAHFDGSSWNLYRSGTESLTQVFAGDGSTVYAFGPAAGLLRSVSGSSFVPVSLPAQMVAEKLRLMEAYATNDVWILTEKSRWHFDGSAWTRNPRGLSTVLPSLPTDFFVTGPETAYFVQNGYVIEDDGTSVGPVFGTSFVNFRTLWASSPSEVFAASTQGVWKYNGVRWTRYGIADDVRAVTGGAPGQLFAITGDNQALRYEGGTWTPLARLALGTPRGMEGYAIHGWPNGSAVVVGVNGIAAHFNGTGWQYLETGSFTRLNGVWGSAPGDVFAVGMNGLVLRYNGTAWSSMPNATANHLNAVWGTSPTNVYAVGGWGTILHWDGSSWKAMRSNTLANLLAIHGTGPDDLIAVGDQGVVLHYDGTAWRDVSSPTLRTSLRAVFATSTTSAVAAGIGVLYNR